MDCPNKSGKDGGSGNDKFGLDCFVADAPRNDGKG